MSVSSIVEAALQKARSTAGGTEKSASAPGQTDLIKEAHQLADANEFIALSAADDGTPGGTLRRSVVEQFFKGADTTAIKGPAQSESPTGTQAVAPQSGAKKILPTGKATGNSPEESESPTGHQATLDQTGTKKADAPLTLLDLLTKSADTTSIPGPQQSVSGQNVAAPPAKNENTNIDLIRSSEAIVNATKRDAKLPTRARLKQLFAHAGDTGASRAAAQAAFPMATAKGGLKEAAAEKENPDDEKAHSRRVGAGAGGALGKGVQAVVRQMPMGAKKELFQGLSHEGAQGLKSGIRHAGLIGAGLGAVGGASTGAQYGAVAGGIHGAGRKKQFDIDHADKKASIFDYAKLAELADSGALGDEAFAILRYADGLV